MAWRSIRADRLERSARWTPMSEPTEGATAIGATDRFRSTTVSLRIVEPLRPAVQSQPWPSRNGQEGEKAQAVRDTSPSDSVSSASGRPTLDGNRRKTQDAGQLVHVPARPKSRSHTTGAGRLLDERPPASFQDRSSSRFLLSQSFQLIFETLLGIVHARLHRVRRDTEDGRNLFVGELLIKDEPENLLVFTR